MSLLTSMSGLTSFLGEMLIAQKSCLRTVMLSACTADLSMCRACMKGLKTPEYRRSPSLVPASLNMLTRPASHSSRVSHPQIITWSLPTRKRHKALREGRPLLLHMDPAACCLCNHLCHLPLVKSLLATSRGLSSGDTLLLCIRYRQQGLEAEKAGNVFRHLTYEGAVNLDSITNLPERQAIEMQISEFGQCPAQLFQAFHPPRSPAALASAGEAFDCCAIAPRSTGLHFISLC